MEESASDSHLRRRLDDYIQSGQNMAMKNANYVGTSGYTKTDSRPEPPSYRNPSNGINDAEDGGSWEMKSIHTGPNHMGGSSYCAIADLSTGHLPFGLEEGAPDYSVFVGTNGNVGFGTSYPNANLHVVGASPSIRLQTSDTTIASSWDMTATPRGFYLHEQFEGQTTLPLIIRPGAASLSLVLADNGGVGLGTDSPSAKLHVIGDARVDGTILVGGKCELDTNTCRFKKRSARDLLRRGLEQGEADEENYEYDVDIVATLQDELELAKESIHALESRLETMQAASAAKEVSLTERINALEEKLTLLLLLDKE